MRILAHVASVGASRHDENPCSRCVRSNHARTAENYGVKWKEFSGQGFENYTLHVSAADGRFVFSYGNICAGSGQWFCGDEPDEYYGSSKVTSARGHRCEGPKTEHHVQLLDGDDLLEVTYSFTCSTGKLLTVSEYFTREFCEPHPADEFEQVQVTGE